MKRFSVSSLVVLSIISCFFFSSCKEEEKPLPLTSLDLGRDTVFRKGQSVKFSYSFNPHSHVLPDFRWESSDNSVVAVNGDGTAMAVGAGKATVTVSVNDGTGLRSSKTVYVLAKPTISIKAVSEVTYFSASFTVQYDMGGGDDAIASCGFVWDTVPTLDTAKLVGRYKAATISTQCSVELLDAGKKYYVRAYAKTPLDLTFSDSVVVETLPVPEDMLGNYMLNTPLARGTVVKYKDWIFYSSMSNGGKLYKIKNDLTGRQLVVNNKGVRSLSFIAPNLYYSTGYGSSKIMRMKIDPSGCYTYPSEDYSCTTWDAALVLGNYIFPSFDYFRISTDGKEKLPTIGFNVQINTSKNKLYFIMTSVDNCDSLYTINESNLDGTQLKELHRGYRGCELGIYENAAYFIEQKQFKRFDLSSPSIVEMLSIRSEYYNIVNYTIYFSNKDDNNKLYKSDLGGNLATKLCDDSVKEISVIDDWLYYYTQDNKFYRIKQDGTSRQLVD